MHTLCTPSLPTFACSTCAPPPFLQKPGSLECTWKRVRVYIQPRTLGFHWKDGSGSRELWRAERLDIVNTHSHAAVTTTAAAAKRRSRAHRVRGRVFARRKRTEARRANTNTHTENAFKQPDAINENGRFLKGTTIIVANSCHIRFGWKLQMLQIKGSLGVNKGFWVFLYIFFWFIFYFSSLKKFSSEKLKQSSLSFD